MFQMMTDVKKIPTYAVSELMERFPCQLLLGSQGDQRSLDPTVLETTVLMAEVGEVSHGRMLLVAIYENFQG